MLSTPNWSPSAVCSPGPTNWTKAFSRPVMHTAQHLPHTYPLRNAIWLFLMGLEVLTCSLGHDFMGATVEGIGSKCILCILTAQVYYSNTFQTAGGRANNRLHFFSSLKWYHIKNTFIKEIHAPPAWCCCLYSTDARLFNIQFQNVLNSWHVTSPLHWTCRLSDRSIQP